jgi:hypothetical protein
MQQYMSTNSFIRRVLPCLGVLAALITGCAADGSPRRAADMDAYERPSLYERQYQRRPYGPWDMQQGAGAQSGPPGPPTWYGCPQQSRNCY